MDSIKLKIFSAGNLIPISSYPSSGIKSALILFFKARKDRTNH
jgi:hypothetical protein